MVGVVLVLVPGPDFAVVTKNTLAGGRPRGWSSAAVIVGGQGVNVRVKVTGADQAAAVDVN